LTGLYVPPTEESDHKKQNMSIQLIGSATSTNTTDIATINALRTSATVFGLSKVDNSTITAAAGVISTVIAAQADQETSTSVVAAVTPGRQQFHPSACKAWVSFNASGTILASYNVASVSRTATGKFTITFTTAFSSANYQCNVSSEVAGNATDACTVLVDSSAIPKTASTVSLLFLNVGATAFVNPTVGHLSCFGDQ
jgi:hypothetical protein